MGLVVVEANKIQDKVKDTDMDTDTDTEIVILTMEMCQVQAIAQGL